MMKGFYATSRYKRLLGMRWLIVTAEDKNIDLLGSVRDKRCPVCSQRFKNVFLLQRHMDTTGCGDDLESILRQ